MGQGFYETAGFLYHRATRRVLLHHRDAKAPSPAPRAARRRPYETDWRTLGAL